VIYVAIGGFQALDAEEYARDAMVYYCTTDEKPCTGQPLFVINLIFIS